jgi:hypothetical protein
MNSLNGLLVFAMLTSCNGFSTGISTALKLEHTVESAIESAEQAVVEDPAVKV